MTEKQSPVYPKFDPEYRKKVMEQLYYRMKVMSFHDYDEYQGKPRGRKPKIKERIETKPRTRSEKEAFKNNFFNFNK